LNSTVLALESLYHEVSSMAKHSIDEDLKQTFGPVYQHLNDLEIEHLIKMTNNVVMKIKQQTKEMLQ